MPSLFEDNMEHEDIAIDGYRDILEKIVADPDYTTNVELDLENIFFDAQFSSSTSIRRYAIELLGLIGLSNNQNEIETCLLALENTDDEGIEYALIIALIRVSTQRSSMRAIDILKRSSWFKNWHRGGDSRARKIFKAIAASKNEDFLDYLHESANKKRYEGGDFLLFEQILGAINSIGSNISEETILTILETCEDHNVTNHLILTLGFVGGTKTITMLREVIFKHDLMAKVEFPSLHKVAFASCSLGRLGDIESVERMIQLWHHGYKSAYIARAFSLLKYDHAIPLLIDGTGENNISVVIGSLRALGEIGGDEAKRHLLYLKEEGIVQHMIEKNSRERDIHFDIKELLWASLILALNQIGEKVDRRRLEEAQEEAKNMWEYHD